MTVLELSHEIEWFVVHACSNKAELYSLEKDTALLHQDTALLHCSLVVGGAVFCK